MIFAQIIIFMLVLSFLVVIHELGHYLTARFFKALLNVGFKSLV